MRIKEAEMEGNRGKKIRKQDNVDTRRQEKNKKDKKRERERERERESTGRERE